MKFKSDSVYSLQASFKNYLLQNNYSIAESNIISNDAFFLNNQTLDITFEEFIEYGLSASIKECLLDYFSLSGNIEQAKAKTEKYVSAMDLLFVYYKNEYAKKLEYNYLYVRPKQGQLVSYCKVMRMQYSYKPLLVLAMLNVANVNGVSTLSEIAHFFITYYANRLKQGLCAEKPDSIFSKTDVSFVDAKRNIMNNAVKKLAKDGIIQFEDEKISFTADMMEDYQHRKGEVAEACNKVLLAYFESVSKQVSDDKSAKEKMLGSVLEKMYSSAPNNDKVIMIHLFGIKYGEIIENENLNLRNIINASGISGSYYVEVRKGIRLSHYVREK